MIFIAISVANTSASAQFRRPAIGQNHYSNAARQNQSQRPRIHGITAQQASVQEHGEFQEQLPLIVNSEQTPEFSHESGGAWNENYSLDNQYDYQSGCNSGRYDSSGYFDQSGCNGRARGQRNTGTFFAGVEATFLYADYDGPNTSVNTQADILQSSSASNGEMGYLGMSPRIWVGRQRPCDTGAFVVRYWSLDASDRQTNIGDMNFQTGDWFTESNLNMYTVDMEYSKCLKGTTRLLFGSRYVDFETSSYSNASSFASRTTAVLAFFFPMVPSPPAHSLKTILWELDPC